MFLFFAKVILRQITQELVSPGLWGFQLLHPRLVRLLHKNKHGQRKFWYFVLRPNDGPQKTAKIGTFKLKFLLHLMNKSARVWRNVYNFTKKSIYFTVHAILGTFWKIKFLKSAINTLYLRSEMFFA